MYNTGIFEDHEKYLELKFLELDLPKINNADKNMQNKNKWKLIK